MRSYRAALLIAGAGLLTFGLVFAIMQASGGEPAPGWLGTAAGPTELATAAPVGSVAQSVAAGQVAVGVPSAGSEPLLQAVQRGDRLDVLASLPSPVDGRPLTVVVVSGVVLRPASAIEPLLLEVSSADALVLAHLLLGGTPLGYTVWPDAGIPAREAPLDEQTARALLGLPGLPRPTPATPEPRATPVPIAATPAPSPSATPRPETYVVQEGESVAAIASQLGVNPGALWWANRTLVDPTGPLAAGTELRVPLGAGILYQVQPQDTWDSVAARFGVPASDLWERNELPAATTLVSGMLLLIPGES